MATVQRFEFIASVKGVDPVQYMQQEAQARILLNRFELDLTEKLDKDFNSTQKSGILAGNLKDMSKIKEKQLQRTKEGGDVAN